MEKSQIIDIILETFRTHPGNAVSVRDAIRPELAGMVLFEAPLVGFADAVDPIFKTYQQEEVVGPWHMMPQDWLPEATAVVSMFFPFTEPVKAGERKVPASVTSNQWLHGRAEGQGFIASYLKAVSEKLIGMGISNCVPCIDERFRSTAGGEMPGYPGIKTYNSNWSERHAAYACGLGTFGLCKGIITEKGMAGRLGSIILKAEVEADERPYTGVYDYCINCGACVRRCPVQAVDPMKGKDHNLCGPRLAQSRIDYAPRHGCGKCQTAVPCESRNPSKK